MVSVEVQTPGSEVAIENAGLGLLQSILLSQVILFIGVFSRLEHCCTIDAALHLDLMDLPVSILLQEKNSSVDH